MTVPAKKYQVINTSLFYSKSNWHQLLSDHLIPLFNVLQQTDKTAYYLLRFSEERGQNVCVSWMVSDVSARASLAKIHRTTKLFFKNNPSVYCTPVYFTHSTFKNYPLNSIHYNLYQFPSFKTRYLSHFDLLRIASDLTAIINHVLISEPIDTETVFTLAFYLHVLLFKTLLPVSNLGTTALLASVNTISEAGTHTQNVFLNNHALFNEIITDLHNEDLLKEDSNKWMLLWSKTCRDVGRKKAGRNTTEQYAGLVNEISGLVLEQLGLHISVQKLIVTFIGQSDLLNQPVS